MKTGGGMDRVRERERKVQRERGMEGKREKIQARGKWHCGGRESERESERERESNRGNYN